MVPKTWICQGEQRYLVKGNYTSYGQEPVNEWLASRLCELLGFDYCPYAVVKRRTSLISVCPGFVADNEEIITADQIVASEQKANDVSEYEHYIRILEDHGIENARQHMEETFITDYLLMNTDRHLINFGVIRKVETLEWGRTVPVFDTGQSMFCGVPTDRLPYKNVTGKLFSNTSKDFETYPRLIRTLQTID